MRKSLNDQLERTLYTIDETSAFTTIPKATLYKWSSMKKNLQPIRLDNGSLVYDSRDIDEYLERCRRTN